ncbi:MAG TPA: ECF-type sigma factor [Thermoguttaceae bacterium]|nr:ECF-type sigma factor [Thermoguttaceae bacterium]
MLSEGSVTGWIGQIKRGDEAAAQQLWQRYFSRLVLLCRKRLSDHPRRAYDEEDVALSAFDSFCQGAHKGNFPQLRDRDNLWPLLVTIATRKAIDYIEAERRQKRGGGQVRGESAIAGAGTSPEKRGVEQAIGNEPTPELAAIVAEEYGRLMECLEDDALRTVAQWKLEGYTNRQIAGRLGCSLSTVARKLWLIRTTWSQEAPGDE